MSASDVVKRCSTCKRGGTQRVDHGSIPGVHLLALGGIIPLVVFPTWDMPPFMIGGLEG